MLHRILITHGHVVIICFHYFCAANQETVVEILQFLQRAFPSTPAETIQVPGQQVPPRTESKLINTGRYKLQTNFDFHRLNILLVRGVIGKDGQQCARKIATATASEARVNLAIRKRKI